MTGRAEAQITAVLIATLLPQRRIEHWTDQKSRCDLDHGVVGGWVRNQLTAQPIQRHVGAAVSVSVIELRHGPLGIPISSVQFQRKRGRGRDELLVNA